jgi:hypothetical protein
VITADANFDRLPAPFPHKPNISGITAVHHGSHAHGADGSDPHNQQAPLMLPVPTYPNQGRIAYSCGLSPTGYRPYGFPNMNAIGNYRRMGWMAPYEMDTPEGARIRSQPPVPNPGNIRLGNQAQLAGRYSTTAFFNYPHALQ